MDRWIRAKSTVERRFIIPTVLLSSSSQATSYSYSATFFPQNRTPSQIQNFKINEIDKQSKRIELIGFVHESTSRQQWYQPSMQEPKARIPLKHRKGEECGERSVEILTIHDRERARARVRDRMRERVNSWSWG
ncbi:hypothetical protein Droror1_Dr00026089 [Drosera rotundifolia]